MPKKRKRAKGRPASPPSGRAPARTSVGPEDVRGAGVQPVEDWERSRDLVELRKRVDLQREAAAEVLRYVKLCRKRDQTWAEVAGALGVSPQAAHRKYAALMPTAKAAVPTPGGP